MRCPKCTVANLVELDDLVACANCGYKKHIEGFVMSKIRGKCVLCERDNMTIDKARDLCSTCYNWSVRDKKPGVPTSLFGKGPQIKIAVDPALIAKSCVRKKGLEALVLHKPDNHICIDDDLLPILEAAEVKEKDINQLLRLALASNGWL